jgi:uncharacterized protein (DUF2252 family)
MLLPETDPHRDTETGQTEASQAMPADFMVDSAGNVAPSTKRRPNPWRAVRCRRKIAGPGPTGLLRLIPRD